MAAGAKINIIRKVEVVEGHGHHGGAWKVAYADFMTAMMAFFLLMWILSSSDEQKLRGIAEYFTNATLPGGSGVLDGATLGPPGTLNASNGAVVARGSDLGKVDDPSPAQWEVRDTTPTSDPEEKVLGTNSGVHEYPAGGAAAANYSEDSSEQDQSEHAEMAEQAAAMTSGDQIQDGEDEQKSLDNSRFESLQIEIMQAMQDNPDLLPLQQNVVFEKTPEGLSIQIIDQKGKPMFSSGQSIMTSATETLLSELGTSLAKLPNPMVITGHTDSVPFTSRKSYDNWDLSSDRANATRRFLVGAGVDSDRLVRVSGMADTDPYVEDNPKDPSNRRISIMLQFQPKTPAAQPKPKPRKLSKVDTQSQAPAKDHNTPIQTASVLDETVFENLRSALR